MRYQTTGPLILSVVILPSYQERRASFPSGFLEYAGTCEPFIRHGTEEACVRNTIDISTYTVMGSCICAYTKPPILAVYDLLQGGGIQVVQRSPDSLYPVWVDSLGSTTEEGLPACQIEKPSIPATLHP